MSAQSQSLRQAQASQLSVLADSPPPWWTGQEIALYFRTTLATVRFWKTTGRINGAKVGRSVLYPLSEIHRLERHLRDAMNTQ